MNFNRSRRSPSANEWKNEKIFFTCFRFGWRSLSTSTRRIHNFSLPNKHRLSRANEIIFSVNENKLSERTVEVFFYFCFPRRVGIQHVQHNSQVGLGWVIFHCEKSEKENFSCDNGRNSLGQRRRLSVGVSLSFRSRLGIKMLFDAVVSLFACALDTLSNFHTAHTAAVCERARDIAKLFISEDDSFSSHTVCCCLNISLTRYFMIAWLMRRACLYALELSLRIFQEEWSEEDERLTI